MDTNMNYETYTVIAANLIGELVYNEQCKKYYVNLYPLTERSHVIKYSILTWVFNQPGEAVSWLDKLCGAITINNENGYTIYELCDTKIIFTRNSLNDNPCIRVYSHFGPDLTIGYNDDEGSSISVYYEQSHDINILVKYIEYIPSDAFNYVYKDQINDNWSCGAISHGTVTEYFILYEGLYTGYHFMTNEGYNKNIIDMIKPDNDHLKINDDVILIGESDGMQLFITMRPNNKISIVSRPMDMK